MATALSAAHAAGIVHRDIKPENVMIRPDGLVKVLDFGLAKLVTTGDDSTGTSTETFLGTRVGTVLGTAAYMSPEQAEGKPIDHRSDIFAFGSLLYEMTAGEPAFTGESMVATLAAVLHKDPATRNGGHCVYPSADETQIYYTKNDGDSALWTMPVAGGPEHEVLPSVVNRAFVVFGDGVYFIPHADRNRRYAVHHLDLRTGIVTPVLPIAGTANLGLSVSPDRRYVLYAETDVGDSDLMLVEGFR